MESKKSINDSKRNLMENSRNTMITQDNKQESKVSIKKISKTKPFVSSRTIKPKGKIAKRILLKIDNKNNDDNKNNSHNQE